MNPTDVSIKSTFAYHQNIYLNAVEVDYKFDTSTTKAHNHNNYA